MRTCKNLPHTVKKRLSIFPVPSRDVTYQTPSGRELLNYSQRGRVLFVTSRRKNYNRFYSVHNPLHPIPSSFPPFLTGKIPYLGSEPVVAGGPGDLFHLGIFHRVRVRTPGKLTAGRLAAPSPLLTQPLLAPLHQRVVRVALVLQAAGFFSPVIPF
jgi:hypothetical protein